MRSRALVGVLVLAAAVAHAGPLGVAGPPKRKPLGPNEREAVLALVKAVDLAQAAGTSSDQGLSWEHHILKSGHYTGYVPFTLTAAAAGYTSAAMYVRAVSRHDGVPSSSEHSLVRDWLLHQRDVMPRQGGTVYVDIGEMPTAGLAGSSSRQSTAAAAGAGAALAMQQRDYERQKRAADEAKRQIEKPELDPLLFPFEEYFFVDLGGARAAARGIERALALPPGEYDVYVGLLDRARIKASSPAVLHRTITIPDFWSDQLALSSLILAKEVRPLKAAFAAPQQAEHPYAFGATEVIPAPVARFTTDEALTVVYQVCNYGAPDADLLASYTFYRTDGARRLFNRTDPQMFGDADLPPAGAWESQAFASQTVPLEPFPPGQYELEVEVRDRLTRAMVKGTVAFTVASGLR